MHTLHRTVALLIAACCMVGCAHVPVRGDGVLGFPLATAAGSDSHVSVTWYGVATLLFDDGATRILIDGFFSRPQMTSPAPIGPDVARIDEMIGAAGLGNLAAITPVHSHFDHAIDLGVIAQKTGATVLGSETTANIARGAGVAESQIHVIPGNRARWRFGAFEVTLIRSQHAPIANGGPPFPGTIDAPLVPPAPLSDWKEGGSYSVVLAHPAGTALVQGSAGYEPGALTGVRANAVMLGIGGLDGLGETHTTSYWSEIVTTTGAGCVFPIHWDDFSKPLGTVEPMDGSDQTAAWIRSLAAPGATRVARFDYGVATDPFAGGC